MKKDLILVVDDVDTNRLILEEILNDSYDIVQAADGFQAVNILMSGDRLPSIILLDIMMPDMDGYEVLDIVMHNPALNKIPVIFITAADADVNESKGIMSGAVDYISKPFNPEVVKARVKSHLMLRHYSESLEEQVAEKVAEIIKTKERMLDTMANMIECRNIESGHHVKRTSALAKITVDYLFSHPERKRPVQKEDLDIIPKAVPLHDLGKIGITDEILLKPGKLTDEEYAVMKTHSAIGSNIIKSLIDDPSDIYLTKCYDIARSHHERWDGRGYPDGLKGDNIPLAARIMALADVYDALVSARVYKPAMTIERAEEIINEGSGTQFDPEVVAAFNDVKGDFRKQYE